jgi:predicted transcriptional regulator of viral defense system
MQTITEIALEKAGNGIFTQVEASCWISGTADRRHSLLKRALATGEVVRIHRGLYALAPRYLPQKTNPFVLAQRIAGPSYISLESALAYHGWIPEATYAVTSVSLARPGEFNTPYGLFSYTAVPQKILFADVMRMETGAPGESFLMASPAKALADYVYIHKCQWTSAHPLMESLRIDEASLRGLHREQLKRLADNYRSKRVRRFLDGLQKDVAP